MSLRRPPMIAQSIPGLLGELRQCRTEVEAMGLRWRNTRFGRYEALLTEDARWAGNNLDRPPEPTWVSIQTTEDDTPRNTLLELTTAVVMRASGFHVRNVSTSWEVARA